MSYVYQKCKIRDDGLDWILEIRPNIFNDTRRPKHPLSQTRRRLYGDPPTKHVFDADKTKNTYYLAYPLSIHVLHGCGCSIGGGGRNEINMPCRAKRPIQPTAQRRLWRRSKLQASVPWPLKNEVFIFGFALVFPLLGPFNAYRYNSKQIRSLSRSDASALNFRVWSIRNNMAGMGDYTLGWFGFCNF